MEKLSHHQENSPQEESVDPLKEEVLKIEQKMDDLHVKKEMGEESESADPKGFLWIELMKLSDDWLEFIQNMDNVSKVSGISEKEIERLAKGFALGELNDSGREDDLNKFIELKKLYDEKIKADKNRND